MRYREAHRATVLLTALVLGAGAAGCSAARVDKAGGSAAAKAEPLALTLAAHDRDYAYGTFAKAVAGLSNGSMRVKIATNWRDVPGRAGIDYERGIVADVRSGRVPLGIIGARVWDTLGVRSFQALVAPFLIESLDLEGRAIQTEFAARALATLSRQGVVGIALLPGPLRRPFGVRRALVGPNDYKGGTIGIRPGGVAETTFDALGGVARGYAPADVSGLDGAELDLLVIAADAFDRRSRPLTGNVVFWPKPQTIIMNRAAFERLTPRERSVLRRAGREAIGPELRRDADDERYERSLLCNVHTVRIARASPSARRALQAKVRPVYRLLNESTLTKAWIAQIKRMREHYATGIDTVRCP